MSKIALRRLRVHEANYVWCVKHGGDDVSLNVSIFLADRTRRHAGLYIRVPFTAEEIDSRTWVWHSPAEPITPIMIRRMIELARANGWQPETAASHTYYIWSADEKLVAV